MRLEVRIKKQLDHKKLDIDFTAENEILGMVGISGAGKSMTLKCIAGLEAPDEGRIVLDGKVLFDSTLKINLPPQKRRVGYVFQDYALFPHLTVKQNIQIVNKDDAEVQELLQSFLLTELANKYPGEISGGQKQRVALARMVAAHPRVILLDEPFSSLDAYVKEELYEYMQELLQVPDRVAVVVTHSMEELGRLTDAVICLDEGRQEPKRETAQFLSRPQTVADARLLGYANIVEKKALMLEKYSIPQSENEENEFSHVAIRTDGFSLEERPGSIRIELQEVQLREDAFRWHLILHCKGNESRILYASFSKENYNIKQLENIKEIYVIREQLKLLTENRQ